MKKLVTRLITGIALSTTLAHAQTPSWQWAKSTSGNSADNGWSICVDALGNSYVTGGFTSTSLTLGTTTLTNSGNIDFFIAKYDPAGNMLWASGATGSSNDGGNGIALDSHGNVYIAGSTNSSKLIIGTTTLTLKGYDDIFIAKYDASGNLKWAKSAGGTSDELGLSVGVDANENAYLTGYFASTSLAIGTTTLTNTGGNDLFVAKYDSLGNALWAKSLGGSGNEQGSGIATDATGNSYITGSFSSSSLTVGSTTLTNNGGIDFLIAKYDPSGNVLWAKGAVGSSNDGGNGIALDAHGNPYVAGSSNSSSLTFGATTLTLKTYDDAFIVKYDVAGNVKWAGSAGGYQDDLALGVSIDPKGNSYLTGYFASSTLYIGYTTTLTNAYPGSNDFFLIGYDSLGNVLTAQSAGGSGDDRGTGVATDAAGNAYVTGYFSCNSISFGATTLTKSNTAISSVLVAKYGSTQTTGIAAENTAFAGIRVMPNPSSGLFELQIKDLPNAGTHTYLSVTDVLGREVYQASVNNITTQLDLSNQPAGMYYITVLTNNTRYISKIMLGK